MKNLTEKLSYLFFAFPLLVFLANCGSDDGPVGGDNDLLGVWTVASVDVDLDINGQTIAEFFTDAGIPAEDASEFEEFFDAEYAGDGFDGTIEFKSDNTYINMFDGDTEVGTWTLIGTALTIISPDGDPIVGQVITLNSSTLVMSLDEIEDLGDSDGDGTDDTLTVRLTITLNK